MDNEVIKSFVDTETGEILYPSQYNAETGEYEGVPVQPQRVKFRIPSAHTASINKEVSRPVMSNKFELEFIKAAVFLLPTMILFHPIVLLILCIVEICLHNWAHRKNKTLKDYPFYYKSPLHGMLKEFCGRCKELNAKEKITRIQDIRNDKMRYGLESIRRVVT